MGTITKDEQANRVARAAHVHGRAVAERRKIVRRAGRALNDAEAVDAELSRATDVFASDNWGNLSLDEIARAAGRIQRLARSLRAAELVPRAREIEAGAKAELDRARGRL